VRLWIAKRTAPPGTTTTSSTAESGGWGSSPDGVPANVAAQFKKLAYKAKKTEWKAHLRMLDKTDPTYKD
jgi:hypothetical protein